MNLHSNKNLFEEAIRTTSNHFGIPEIYIEKDYWVTKALKAIFESEIGDEAVFKGGTSLSKCFGMIERFSEDIDIVVTRKEGETDNQMKKKIKLITKVVSEMIPEVEHTGITHKRGQIRKTAHEYLKSFRGAYGQVREHIILEASWLGNSEPFTEVFLGSMIGEMMQATGNAHLVKAYEMEKFEVRALHPNRTFCEKIMSLVRFSYSEHPIRDLGNKIRHVYDLAMMLKQPEVEVFFESFDFDTVLKRVANDDRRSFRDRGAWIDFHPAQAMIFADSMQVWHSISKTYRKSFSDLVFGELPDEAQMLTTLQQIFLRISKVSWVNSMAS